MPRFTPNSCSYAPFSEINKIKASNCRFLRVSRQAANVILTFDTDWGAQTAPQQGCGDWSPHKRKLTLESRQKRLFQANSIAHGRARSWSALKSAIRRNDAQPSKPQVIVTIPFTSTGHSNLVSTRASPNLDRTQIGDPPKQRTTIEAPRNRRVTVCFCGEAEAYWRRRKAHLVRHVEIAKCAAPMVVAEAIFQICWGFGACRQRPNRGVGTGPHYKENLL